MPVAKDETAVASSEVKAPAPAPGFAKKNLLIIGGVLALLWALAIVSGSLVFLIVMGVLTVAVAGVLLWVRRLVKRQQGLTSLLQSASQSPEARRAAIAKLEAEKDPNDVTNIIARAQLEAADDPKKALEMLEAVERKKVPVAIQDDFGALLSQLYLNYGRAKDARPLVDKINVDSSDRAAQRGFLVAIVAEAWARTGKHEDALNLLATADPNAAENREFRMPLLVARVFARFAAGKRGPAREDLKTIADVDVNHLGRFLMPQFRVHPDLQRLARQVAQASPQVRGAGKAMAHPGMRRGMR